MKALITFTTDFGTKDEYVGTMKGVIKTINPDTQFIDISNEIPSWDIKRAAFYIGYAYRFFPEKTIHVVIVDPGVGTKRNILCVDTEMQVFLAPDNGVLSVVLDKEKSARVYKVSNKRYMLNNISHTFHGRDIFAPVAAHMSKGITPDKIGHRLKTFKKLDRIHPILIKEKLIGEVVYADRFGNMITNIDFEILSKLFKSKKENPKIKIGNFYINRLLSSYEESDSDKPFAIFGSKGLLEISVKKGSARDFFGRDKLPKVEISL